MSPDLIFLIDDDKATVFLDKIMLEEAGLSRVKTFHYIDDALRALHASFAAGREEDYPAIILLDINLPGKTGWDFLDEMRTLPFPYRQFTKIFITSASDYPRDLEKAKNYPEVVEFLPKPLTEELALRLRNQYVNV